MTAARSAALRGGHQPDLAAGRARSVREADFRALYDAAVVAVHRNGSRLTNKIGDIELRRRRHAAAPGRPRLQPGLSQQPGLLPGERRRGLAPRALRPGLDRGGRLRRHDRGVSSAARSTSMLGRVPGRRRDGRHALHLARRRPEGGRLAGPARHRRVVRRGHGAGALGRRRAVRRAAWSRPPAPFGPTATLAAIYFGTMVLNELISNNAAAVLAFPFCLESARLLGRQRPAVHHGRDPGRLATRSPRRSAIRPT